MRPLAEVDPIPISTVDAKRDDVSERFSMRAVSGVLLIAFLLLLILVAKSPDRLIYDEPYFANYIQLLHQYGLSKTFLNALTAAPGPLCSFIQVIFEPMTRLLPVRMRFVNVFLLLVVISMLTSWLRELKCGDYVAASCSVLVVPMTWIIAGMALSEMSAVVFVTLSLYLQLRGLAAMERGRPVMGWFLASGVSLGIAVWGRQPYLLLVGVPALLALLEKKLRAPALVFGVAAIAVTLPLFVIWNGLLPPSNHGMQQGFSLIHCIFSFAYTGICLALLAPRFVRLPIKIVVGLVTLTVVVNALVRGFVLYPVRSLVDRCVPASVVPAFGNFCGSLFLSCGVVSLALLLKLLWDGRRDLKLVAVHGGLLCVAASPIFVAHQYSSRYTAMSLPYLILAAQPLREWTLKTVVSAAVGCGIGFLSLFGYFSH
jgi:hypothetical protein